MKTAQQLDMNHLPVGTLVISKESPEWGTWAIRSVVNHDGIGWYEIQGRRNSRVLHKSEAVEFWKVVA